MVDKQKNCLEVLENTADDIWKIFFIAQEYKFLKEFSKAKNNYKKILELDYKQEVAYSSIGWIEYELGNINAAIQNWKEYLLRTYIYEQNKDDKYKIIEILFQELSKYPELEQVLFEFGKKTKNIVILKRLISLNPENIEYIQLYLEFGWRENYSEKIPIDDAIEYSIKLIELEALNPKHYNFIGDIYFENKDFEKAFPYHKKAIELGGNGAATWKKNIALHYQKDQNTPYSELVVFLKENRPKEFNEIILKELFLSLWYMNKGDNERYLVYHEEYLKTLYTEKLYYFLVPEGKDVFSLLFEFYLQYQQIDKGITFVEKVVQNIMNSEETNSYSFKYYHYSQKIIPSLNILPFETVKSFIDKIPNKQYWIDFLYQMVDNRKSSDEIYVLLSEKYLTINPNETRFNYRLIDVYIKLDKYEEAIDLCKRDSHSHDKIPNLYLKLKKIDEAKKSIISNYENKIIDIYSLWQFFEEIGESEYPKIYLKEKIKNLNDAKTLSEEYHNLSILYSYEKKYDEAIYYCLKADELHFDLWHKYSLWLYYLNNNDLNNAIVYLSLIFNYENNNNSNKYITQIVLKELYSADLLERVLMDYFTPENYNDLLNVILNTYVKSHIKIKLYTIIKKKVFYLPFINLYDLGQAYLDNKQFKEAEETLEETKTIYTEEISKEQGLFIYKDWNYKVGGRLFNKDNFLFKIDIDLGRIKKEKEHEFKNKQGYLSFISHTLKNALSGGSQTIERIIDTAKEALEEDFVKNDMAYYAFTDLSKLKSTFILLDSMMESFKLFTRKSDDFIKEWEKDENGEGTPKRLIATIVIHLLNRILFSDAFGDVRERLFKNKSEDEIIEIQQMYLKEMATKEINKDTENEVLNWIKETIQFIEIQIDDNETNWSLRGVKYNLIFSILSETLLNAMKYSNGTSPIHFKWNLHNNWSRQKIEIFCLNNYDEESIKESDSKSGINFIENLLNKLKGITLKKEDGKNNNSFFQKEKSNSMTYTIKLEIEVNKK